MDAPARRTQRRVIRAVIGYGVVAFALLQIVEPIMHGLHLPDATLTWFVLALALAFPVVVLVSWALDRLGLRDAPEAHAGSGSGFFILQGAGSPASIALLVLLVAALAALVALLATRPRLAAAREQRLTQVSFAAGTEEYPAWSPDGKQLVYVAQSGKVRNLFRRVLETGEEAQLTHGDYDELQPSFAPDGQSLLFVRAQQPGLRLQPGDVWGGFEGGDVWRLDLRSAKETRLVAEAFDPQVSPDGAQIAVDAAWAGPYRLWVLDAAGHNPQQVSTDTTEATAHLAPRWSPDGKKLLFQNVERTKLDVRVLDLGSKQLSFITDDAAADIRPVWSPSGHAIYFSSDRGGGVNIWRAPVGADGKLAAPLQQITTGAGQDVEPALSPDGKRIAFATLHQNADLWRLPVSPATGLATGAPEALIATTREDSRGAWSPDGSAIAFNSDRGGEMNIWLFSLRDRSSRQLTRGRGGDFQPSWSPDATRLAFFSSRSGTPDLWQVEMASGKLAPLTTGPSIDINPSFSPDGKRLAFQSDRSGRLEVWLAAADGKGPRQLTSTGVSGHFLRWSAASDAVIYRCPCGAKPVVMAVPVAGGEPVRFAEPKGGAHLSFSPDRARFMDVVGHKVLWVSPIAGGAPLKVFEFADPEARIDYPVWSPDGAWVLFDRLHPEGGDVWVLDGLDDPAP